MQQIIPRASPSRKALSSFVCQSCRRSLRRFSASPNRRSGGVPPPPPSGYAHLSSRRLISVAGPDAPRFLHGIITRSVVAEPSTSGGRRFNRTTNADAAADAAANSIASTPGFYAAFLNATGRVLHDVFVYRDTLGLSGGGGAATAAEGEAFVIEVDADQVDVLAHHIKRYKLRSKLACRVLDAEECAAWQVWDDSNGSSPPTPTPQGLETQLSQLQNSIVLPDTRAPGMGTRVLRLGSGSGAGHLDLDLDLEKSDEAAYRVRRYLLGVAEGQAEIPREQALPLEANMDVSGGVDFRKGCYVGQELTIRTRHRGVVRKRILPCLLYPSSSSPSSSSPSPPPPPPRKLDYSPWIGGGEEQGEGQVMSAEDVPPNLSIGRDGAKGRSAGTWLRGVGNVGLALCRLQIMTDVELPGETAAAPFNPDKDEFVVKWGADEEGGGGQSVKIKAFVPDWLRERLNEDKNAGSAH
ncbi:Aminomethyltransferase folate-binding domain-containing protein [Annulohypoxylon truncatum]|uniref:Aminomethyltransferase folate-binding domain-containing protein n=1 Tax=Annulohypoxylon truncatum TaxID=327061 RepID=UPI0020085458|nr:Aminomethyltransferase folate-binding domain-containing protein [Annulohypoxylon truncatum]KAI1212295.1 Aminomethyltransferase folate-binding domain-containing protein [Annulohypoxylon truncatum]